MKIIIIGGIAAGMSAAAKLRRADKYAKIIVYEKSKHVSFGACGLPYYVGGFFTDNNNMIARTKEKFMESGIDVFTEHEVVDVNTDISVVKVKNIISGQEFEETYDKLLIATGASSIIPPIKNVNLENVHTLKSMEDGIALREKMKKDDIKKVAIIGAGFIGLEAVEAALENDKEVYVFQLEDRILKEVFDKEVTDILEDELKSKGVKLYLNTMVTELKGSKTVESIVAEGTEEKVDLVIVAAGVRPNTEFLRNTNIEMLRNGAIVIDNEGKTSVENIYSAGDCATIPHMLKENAYVPLATGANKLGRIVGENLSGKHEKFEGTLASSCIKVLEMEAGRTGLSEKEAETLGIPYKTVFIKDKNQTSYYPGQEDIYVKLVYHGETKVLLGGQVVGKKDAVQRTNVLAVAIAAKFTTDRLGMIDLCYAPPFARTWDVINVAGNVAK